MSQRPAQKTKALAARPDSQLLLPIIRTNDSGPIPEPNRSQCVELLRMMLQRVVEEHHNIENETD